jgi:Skp family chaperone for outer membrane proteins
MSIPKFVPVAALAALCSFLPIPGSVAALSLAEVVGVVDLARAIETYPKWIATRQQMKDLQEQARGRLAAKTKRVEELRATLASMNEDAQERIQQEFWLRQAREEQQFVAQELDLELKEQSMRFDLDCYEDMEGAIATVAKAKGLRIVHRLANLGPRPANIATMRPPEVQARLNMFERKQVWYSGAELDITADVIKELMVPRANPAPAPAASPIPASSGGDNRGGG